MEKLLQQATSLDDVYKTLSPEPLIEESEFHAFYDPGLNAVRGGDKVARINLNLQRSFGGAYYRAFLMGHQGVGKSTELTRLVHEARPKFSAIRFSATRDLNPAGFKPFDVLLVMLLRLMEETEKHTERHPSEKLLQDVQRWFAHKTKTYKQTSSADLETAAEASAGTPSLWESIAKLRGSLKASLKFASDRETKVEEYELALIPELIALVNSLLDECSRHLQDAHKQEWLFIGEDFDKAGIPAQQTEDLFLKFGNIFHELRTHMIFTIPINLVYSDRASQLAFAGDRIHTIPDTPVFTPDHQPNEAGRQAVAMVLQKRMSPDLFEGGQMTRLIVASGGNLRDLFKMAADAADNAILRKTPKGKIGPADAEAAINALRIEYLRRLGENIFDEEQTTPITYEVKAQRLQEVYHSTRKPTVSDAALYSLLRARAVQEFNGEGWFGVHPLVVDILKAQERLVPSEGGQVLGGTQ